MQILKETDNVIICVKPSGVLSTDETGGMPSLVKEAIGNPAAEICTVHRLDRVVSGLMVLAKSSAAASILGEQIMSRTFEKEYLAVIHGILAEEEGTFRDLLFRDRTERKTYVAAAPGKGVKEAVLDYTVLAKADALSLVRITLRTGRTHQIRAQFSSRGMPLVGDRKYSTCDDSCDIALWSYRLAFNEPMSGERIDVSLSPPDRYPWNLFRL